jgi:hypothetical protein
MGSKYSTKKTVPIAIRRSRIDERQGPDGRRGHSSTMYEDDEWEFIKAMDRYKRENKRMNPTCVEVLAVLKSLGYRKVTAS